VVALAAGRDGLVGGEEVSEVVNCFGDDVWAEGETEVASGFVSGRENSVGLHDDALSLQKKD
jgi:hypothetical protein